VEEKSTSAVSHTSLAFVGVRLPTVNVDPLVTNDTSEVPSVAFELLPPLNAIILAVPYAPPAILATANT
jgi:hypothetical protein